MRERHEHFPLTQLPEPHVVLHDRIAARVGVLVAQPLEDALGGVTLLLAFRLVLFQDLIDGADPGVQFRPARRLLPPIAWRHRIPQHLADRVTSQPELPGRLAFTHFVDDDRSPNTRIQLHCVHLSGVPQNISLWECSMEPVFDGLVLLRRKTPLTRRLLVYSRSGAYRTKFSLESSGAVVRSSSRSARGNASKRQ
jgi:hypothetical protein